MHVAIKGESEGKLQINGFCHKSVKNLLLKFPFWGS